MRCFLPMRTSRLFIVENTGQGADAYRRRKSMLCSLPCPAQSLIIYGMDFLFPRYRKLLCCGSARDLKSLKSMWTNDKSNHGRARKHTRPTYFNAAGGLPFFGWTRVSCFPIRANEQARIRVSVGGLLERCRCTREDSASHSPRKPLTKNSPPEVIDTTTCSNI